jgi:hypothetical protein
MLLADERIVRLRVRRDGAAVLADGTILHVESVAELRIAGGDHVYDRVDVQVGRELGELDR